jgi:glycosyltransferase involved in cell wall biosynthesis
MCTLLGRMLRLPVYATFQGNDFERNPISRAVRPAAVRSCDGLFIGPGTEIERVRTRYKLPCERVVQVFNPVDLGLWDAIDRNEARAVFNLPHTARVAVWHGRVAIDSKGLDVLLDAWQHICQQRPEQDLRLLMMGTGQDADQLSQRLSSAHISNIQWFNEYITDRKAILQFLSAGDVYAFPSRYEGFAVAPIEAMACGLPVVAAQASGIPDIFESDEASGGIVVPRGDATAFAQALGRVLDDEQLGRQLGRLARLRVEQAFSLEAVGMQLRSFLLRTGISAGHIDDRETPGRAVVE